MFRVRDLISEKIDTEFWLEEDEDYDAILLKTKLTIDQQSVTYESFCENLGFKTVRSNNDKSCINVYYSFGS